MGRCDRPAGGQPGPRARAAAAEDRLDAGLADGAPASGDAPRHVLALSDEPENLRELRLHAPLGELYRRGEIGGYTVWSRDRMVMTTLNDPDRTPVDAVWLQRRPSSATVLALHALGRPFLLDIDDHLLVSPTYRAAFPPEHMQMGRIHHGRHHALEGQRAG